MKRAAFLALVAPFVPRERLAGLVARGGSLAKASTPLGAKSCSRLQPASDWPELFVEGSRASRKAVWRSSKGGSGWRRLGGC